MVFLTVTNHKEINKKTFKQSQNKKENFFRKLSGKTVSYLRPRVVNLGVESTLWYLYVEVGIGSHKHLHGERCSCFCWILLNTISICPGRYSDSGWLSDATNTAHHQYIHALLLLYIYVCILWFIANDDEPNYTSRNKRSYLVTIVTALSSLYATAAAVRACVRACYTITTTA